MSMRNMGVLFFSFPYILDLWILYWKALNNLTPYKIYPIPATDWHSIVIVML